MNRFATIDEYIQAASPEARPALVKIRQIIHRAAPAAVETIAYQMPTFDLNGKHLVHVAKWKNHISMYPMPAGDKAFQDQIAPFLAAKSTARFSLKGPIPYPLVEKIVRLRVSEKTVSKSETE